MDNTNPQALPQRPNLEKQSVAFAGIKGVGLGAALVGAIGFAVKGGQALLKSENSMKAGEIGRLAAIWGVVNGLIDMEHTNASNRQKAQTRPYVERLEQELLAKNMQNGPARG